MELILAGLAVALLERGRNGKIDHLINAITVITDTT